MAHCKYVDSSSPDPVGREGVGEDIEGWEDEKRPEVAPLRHGARHDGGGESRERQLVEEGESSLRSGSVVPREGSLQLRDSEARFLMT